jgi:aspartate/glutamate racemase
MKIIGMIGGIGPESTIDYYRRLLEGAQKRNPGGPALQIVINSIDLQKGLDLLGANKLKELTEYIVPEVMRPARCRRRVWFSGGQLSAHCFWRYRPALAYSAGKHC